VESATAERLPGLEAPVERVEPQPGHWIERGPQKRLMLFSGRSHPELAARIAEKLGLELGAVELKTFANGETYCRYEESIRGADLFLIQTGCEPVDRNLVELLIMINAASSPRRSGSPPSSRGSRTRARTRSPPRASRSPRSSSPTCCKPPAPIAS